MCMRSLCLASFFAPCDCLTPQTRSSHSLSERSLFLPSERNEVEFPVCVGMEVSFPDRFHVATAFFDQKFGNLEETTDLTDLQKLAFYALRQQAEKGPCKEPAPYMWNLTAKYKHAAWCQLGAMSPFEAMVYFVKQLEEVCGPDWITAGPVAAGGLAASTGAAAQQQREPADEEQLAGLSVEDLRAEVQRLRLLLRQHGVSAQQQPRAAPPPPLVAPSDAATASAPVVAQTAAAAPGNGAAVVAEIPTRALRPSGAPPPKPLAGAAAGKPHGSSNGQPRDTADGPVYYSTQKMGWLEWLGVSSPQPDPRIV
jgi:acyl-CoA-binding protein